jgi:hypothetical protein
MNLEDIPQDVGIAAGISPRKSQDVGITFFLNIFFCDLANLKHWCCAL